MSKKWKSDHPDYGPLEFIENSFGFVIDPLKKGGMKVFCTKTNTTVKFSKKLKEQFIKELTDHLNTGVEK